MDRRALRRIALGAWLLLPLLCFVAVPAGAQPRQPQPRPGSPTAERARLLEIPKVPRDKRICFALYTLHNNVLKLTAQLYPLEDDEPRTLALEVARGDGWKEVARAEIVNPGWTATFRVDKWDMTRPAKYRVRHGQQGSYEGTVQKDPADKDVIVVAAFTGNSIYPGHGGDIPRQDIVDNIKRLKPDLLFFSGDQVYDHNQHYAYWLKFGREFGDAIKDVPTVTIPDDHDVGHPNLWGAGGKKSDKPTGDDGGYFKPVEYVKEVERAQTSHLPDPVDPTPIQRGIGVYYTHLNVGGISFAIIEDRKWKTGPEGVIKVVPELGPRPDHIRNPKYDPKALDVPGAELLGERQLKFLREWGQDWTGARMKCVLSQTIFAGGAHLHGQYDNRIYADLDSNGWPQAGRNKALAEMRKSFAFHIAGDQHLATVIHHGIDEFDDAVWSFCVPSIANLYLRWWVPEKPGENRKPGQAEHLGRHLDGFGNRVTMHAVANPDPKPNGGDKLTTRAAGWGIVRFNKADRTITMECWPRNVDITAPANKPYPGWPITISQFDNYARKPAAYLPTLKVGGATDPVVQVVEEKSGEIVYTVRIKGGEFRPPVFAPGAYTVRVGDGAGRKEIKGVQALPEGQAGEVKVDLP